MAGYRAGGFLRLLFFLVVFGLVAAVGYQIGVSQATSAVVVGGGTTGTVAVPVYVGHVGWAWGFGFFWFLIPLFFIFLIFFAIRAATGGHRHRGWGYGLSVLDDGRYTWEGGLGTAWSNVPSQDLTVVVLTQRSADETGMPAVCDNVLSAARLE